MVGLQVTVLDDGDNEQRQAHLPSAKHYSIHGAYGTFVARKFADGSSYSRCKNRIEIVPNIHPPARHSNGIILDPVMGSEGQSKEYQHCELHQQRKLHDEKGGDRADDGKKRLPKPGD
jgi:hypothetical protein